jgi:signal transduction histidine kinase
MKSAYAPVLSGEDKVIGILGVEAGAGFFSDLKALTNVIAFILAASFIAVAVLGLLFYRQSVALDRAQEAVIRRENLATMGRMVANIAHDIRNPLSIINTSAERLRKKHKLDDEIFSYISEEVDGLNRILSGYLEFAGSSTGEYASRSAQKIVRRCLMVLEPEFEAKHIHLVQNVSTVECRIMGNDKRIQQAVLNVLLNALQAVDVRGRIEVSLDRRPPYGVILIKDNGCGIEEKDLKEVTKPFFTGKADGSGLGLSIVKTIIDEHDGDLKINSKSGRGTDVELYFPLSN